MEVESVAQVARTRMAHRHNLVVLVVARTPMAIARMAAPRQNLLLLLCPLRIHMVGARMARRRRPRNRNRNRKVQVLEEEEARPDSSRETDGRVATVLAQ